MTPSIRAASVLGIAAAATSAPLVAILSNLLGSTDVPPASVYFASPVFIGLVATMWWLIVWRFVRPRSGRGVAAGVASSVLTFFTFAAVFDIAFHGEPSSWPLGQAFVVISMWGFAMFGWTVLAVGALCGWYVERRWNLK